MSNFRLLSVIVKIATLFVSDSLSFNGNKNAIVFTYIETIYVCICICVDIYYIRIYIYVLRTFGLTYIFSHLPIKECKKVKNKQELQLELELEQRNVIHIKLCFEHRTIRVTTHGYQRQVKREANTYLLNLTYSFKRKEFE